jgi:hypothetical protein
MFLWATNIFRSVKELYQKYVHKKKNLNIQE